MQTTLLSKFFMGDTRSVKAKKNIIVSGFIKGADMLVYLLLVPLTLGYLNAYEYGIWLTLNSLLTWIDSFDIGLGNGLRNKLAEAIANDDKMQGRIYVSTTLYMLIFIISIVFVFLAFIIKTINWYSLLNVDAGVVPNLEDIILVSVAFFCLNFVFKFIGSVYMALQQPAVNYLIVFLGHLLSLIAIYALTLFTTGNLLLVAIVYSAAPLLIYIVAYPITFLKIYPYLSPSYSLLKKNYLKELMGLSILFFLLQIMGVVIFSMSNIIISKMFGPDQVTPYNIVYRYFSLLPIFFNLLLAPLWSATTDAYTKGDYDWIKRSRVKLNWILALFGLVLLLMVVCSDFVYKIWIGNEINIDFLLSLSMGVYMFVLLWSMSYSYFLNGIGRLYVQTINTFVACVLFCPLCYSLCKGMGVIGVVICMSVVNLSGAVLNTIQLHKVLSRTDKGIWGK